MINKIKSTLVFSAVMAIAIPAVAADTLSYASMSAGFGSSSYQTAYAAQNLEGYVVNFDASIPIHSNLAFMGEFSASEIGSQVKGSYNSSLLGIYFHAPVFNRFDIILGTGFINSTFKVENFDNTAAAGIIARVGARVMVLDKFEVSGSATRSFIDDNATTQGKVMGSFYLDPTNTVSVNLGLTDEDSSRTGFISFSKYF